MLKSSRLTKKTCLIHMVPELRCLSGQASSLEILIDRNLSLFFAVPLSAAYSTETRRHSLIQLASFEVSALRKNDF